MCSVPLKQGSCIQKMETMIVSSIEGGFLRGDMYSEINRQNIRLTHPGTVSSFYTKCNFITSTWYCPVSLFFLNYQAFKYSL